VTLTHHLLLFTAKLTLGLAGAMAFTSPRKVTSGFFRVHLWVILGLQVLATLAALSLTAREPLAMGMAWLSGITAGAAYVGSVIWIYERLTAGRIMLWLIVALSLVSGIWLQWIGLKLETASQWPMVVDFAASGLLLGAVTTAMLLGHWYLNTPTMELAPLRRLLGLIAVALLLRALIAAVGAALVISQNPLTIADWTFFALRWLSGLVAPAVLTKMTWETLKIPNTQSATGILYAGVILVFVGELVSQLFGAHWHTPI
jgi:hypothetical protein